MNTRKTISFTCNNILKKITLFIAFIICAILAVIIPLFIFQFVCELAIDNYSYLNLNLR